MRVRVPKANLEDIRLMSKVRGWSGSDPELRVWNAEPVAVCGGRGFVLEKRWLSAMRRGACTVGICMY